MIQVLHKLGLVLCVMGLSGCSQLHVASDHGYRLSQQQLLPLSDRWRLKGRMGVISPQESFSASVNWSHEPALETIELSGPLGQGAVKIILGQHKVSIDDGHQLQDYTGHPEDVFSHYYGVDLPVESYTYWLSGQPDPRYIFIEKEHGFQQNGWDVEYQGMQQVGERLLPKKLRIKNQNVKVKFFIDQWIVTQ